MTVTMAAKIQGFDEKEWRIWGKKTTAYRQVGNAFPPPVAKAMGAEGIVVDKVSNVGDAFRAACKAQKDGKTTIVEMMCTKELGDPFRRDALKKPHRLLEKYKGLS